LGASRWLVGMVFEKLRSRIIGRVEHNAPSDEAIRAHVLGEIHAPSTPPFEPISAPARPAAGTIQRGRYGAEFEGERPIAPVEGLGPPDIEAFPRHELLPAPTREMERRIEERGIYELLDRLTVIETQLATIRAQNETINERMKTFEMYLRSRLPRSSF